MEIIIGAILGIAAVIIVFILALGLWIHARMNAQ